MDTVISSYLSKNHTFLQREYEDYTEDPKRAIHKDSEQMSMIPDLTLGIVKFLT